MAENLRNLRNLRAAVLNCLQFLRPDSREYRALYGYALELRAQIRAAE